MSKAWNYILAHWRGEQGLLKSCLLNGFIFPSVAVIAVVYAGLVAEAEYFAWRFVSHRELVANPTKAGAYGATACFLTSLPVCLWAVVGVFRCGLRNVRNSANTTNRRIGGAIALLFGLWLTASISVSAASVFSNAFTHLISAGVTASK
jgi:hypothetical protein